MTHFIVHVGPHKTGSTYLQECFALCRPQLAERGIYFPTTWGTTAHHALYDRLRTVPNPRLEAEFAELHAGRHERVLISVEGLAGLPEASVAYFHSLVGAGNTLQCIFYARAWGDILPSHWKELVKAGDTMSLPDYLFRRLHNPVVSFFVNFGVGLRLWAKYFGTDAISIVAYNQLVALKRDLFTHFAERFLAWPHPPKLELAAANVSPGTADIEAIRAIAALERIRAGHVLPVPYAGALSERYMRRKADLVTPTIAGALQDHTTRIFVNEAIPALAALHRELMEQFGASIVPPRLPNYFFRPRRAEIPFVHSDWLLVPGVLDDVRVIQQTLRAEVEATGRTADSP